MPGSRRTGWRRDPGAAARTWSSSLMIRAAANLLPLRAAGSTVSLVPKVSYRAALAVPEFRALFATAATAITAQVVSSVVLTVLVFDRTRSPLLSAATFSLGF